MEEISNSPSTWASNKDESNANFSRRGSVNILNPYTKHIYMNFVLSNTYFIHEGKHYGSNNKKTYT